jgi:predicted DNA-binding antitoxin AbrB/MazE fold protein
MQQAFENGVVKPLAKINPFVDGAAIGNTADKTY